MVTIVDTSVWVSRFRGHVTPAAAKLESLLTSSRRVYMTDIVYAELLAGDLSTAAARQIERFRTDDRVIRLTSLTDFVRAAECRRAARRAGRTVRSISDCLIASVCIREDAVLLHDDRDFSTLAEFTELRQLVP